MSADRELLPTATARRTGRVAAELIRPQRARAWLTAAVFVAAAVTGLVGPLALGRIVEAVQGRSGGGQVTAAALVLLGAALAQAALTALGAALTAQVGETALARLRERVIARAFALPAQRIEQVGAGDLAARIGDDAALVGTAVRGVLPSVTGAALTICFTVLGLTALDWRFALAGLCALPIQTAALRWYLRHSGPLYAAQRVAGGERSRQILESVSGAETVRAFRLTADHTRRIAQRSAVAKDFALRAVTLRSRFYGRLNAAEFTGLALILTVGWLLVHTGRANVGEATAAALLFIRLFDPVNILLGLAATVQEAAAGLARLVGAADLVPGPDRGGPAPGPDDGQQASGPHSAGAAASAAGRLPAASAPGRLPAADAPGRLPAADAPGRLPTASAPGRLPAAREPDAPAQVTVRDVHHAYVPGDPVLHGVSLRLARGEHVTLVGASGAGKSTLARIVAGVHPPTAGRVTVHGQGEERPAVLLLDQDTHVFADTVAGNLRLARPDAGAAAMTAALEAAGAWPWVRALPQRLDTPIGSGATELTPVQAQQLALARLALADPPVAVLDESAAEAGSDGARTLEAAARRVLRGRTALVVAHRLSQAATADRVVVMEAGRIVEEGGHLELVAAGGRYARLWAAWSDRTSAGPGELAHNGQESPSELRSS
ncbi:ABC transporter transmembrane domain-containing protein [Streptomyces sp. NBC_01476]|uniref:ABC transporter ATP-binding protein n=1 Tax=Streptomyces sp. NBC_01476 TaxID=2903881 RepID=UPI002E366340|nr:ABC transporter transmembrane domain-containing protein [Streptomyces sp. NBC_01476]